MRQPVFIKLENSLEEAMTYRNSPQMEFYNFAGVHLQPQSPFPYIQRTYAEGGIELEDYIVWVCDMCGNRLYDISDYFGIVRNFDDPDTGTPQLEWSLTYVDFDAGYQLVYLEIEQGANDKKYTSPFYLTSEGIEYTARVDYRNAELNATMLSTGLNIWFKQDEELMEQSTYDAVVTGRRTAVTTKLVEYEVWQTGIIDITFFRRIKQMFRNKYVYVDLERTVVFEPFESPRLEGKENFAEQELLLCRDNSDKYNPLYTPPIPPDPPVDAPFITLIQVNSLDLKNVSYVFTYGFFEPTYLQYQYSLDGITWTTSTGGITSPWQPVQVANNQGLNYYYRIYHEGTDTESNVVQLPPKTIVIDNITSPQSSFIQIGNTYYISYTINGFTPTSDLSFEASVDGVNWQPMYYAGGYQNPKTVQTPSSGIQFTKFRIRYNPFGITSNVFNFSF